MWEILGFILQIVLEVFSGCLESDEYWRLSLPIMVGILGAAFLDLWGTHGGLRLAAAVLSLLGGIVTGIVWQVRKG